MKNGDSAIRGSTMALAAINLALVAVVVVQVSSNDEHSIDPAMTDLGSSIDTTGLNPQNTEYSAPAIGYYEEVIARPLFSSNRLPPEAAAVSDAGSAKNIAPPTFTLIGVVITQQVTKALLLPKKGKQTVHVTPGDTVEGWRVETIQPDRIEVSKGEHLSELILERVPPAARGKRGKIPPALVPGSS